MRRILLALAGSACLAATAACASATDGAGHQADSPSVTGAIDDEGVAVSVITGADHPDRHRATVDVAERARHAERAGVHVRVLAPTGGAPPLICRSGGCTRNRAVILDGTYGVVLWTASTRDGASGASVLELTQAGRAVWWQVTGERIGDDLLCSPRPVPNCVVVDGAGAHASVATGYVRHGAALMRTGAVQSDTPTTDPADLNGDGMIDVVTAINTYQPSYATGTVYWQTYRAGTTGFTSTGCTQPAQVLGPEPTRLLSGTCPS